MSAAAPRAGPPGRPVQAQLTRGDLLRRAVAAGGLLTTGGLLAACGGGTVGGADVSLATAPASFAHTVSPHWTFANWPLYIDGKTHHRSLEDFDARYGTRTTYLEIINDNAQFFGKVQPQLQAGEDIGYDIVVLTDWMANKWMQLGYVEALDTGLLPNVQANLTDVLRGRSIDPEDRYLVPWQSGLTGIGYNAAFVDEPPTSVSDLWNPRYKGHVTLLTEMQDTLGLVMLDLGIDPADATLDDAQQAVDVIRPQVESGQVRRFTGNDYIQGLSNGSIVMAMVWSGDMVQLDNPDLRFVVPREGCMIWTDNMLIPRNAQHPYNAHLWMNYYYRPRIAAMVEDAVDYICPVDGAEAAMLAIDPDVARNPLIFPPRSTTRRAHVFKALSPDEDEQFNQLFQSLQGA